MCALLGLFFACGLGCGDRESAEPSPFRWQPAPPAVPGAQADAETGLLESIGYLGGYQSPQLEGGVSIHEAELAWPGLNLYTSGHAPEALLLDMDGQQLHRWGLPFERAFPGTQREVLDAAGTQFWRRVRLLENGDLLAIFDYHGLVRIDRESKLQWGKRGQYHHDLWLGEAGLWVLRVVDSRDGALPDHPGSVFEEELVLIDPDDGRELRRISLLEAFRSSRYKNLLAELPGMQDVFHNNTIEILTRPYAGPVFKPGRALVSLRNIHTLAVVDLDKERVVWASTGPWRMQHEPQLLDNGRLLLFDNLGAGEHSRILELDPFSRRIEWSYGSSPEQTFLSKGMGSQQRLPNGNTLITDSFAGRAFEVTAEGRMVWRFDNPARTGEADEYVGVLPELLRLEPQRVPALLAAPDRPENGR
jgi:hypothetical protein